MKVAACVIAAVVLGLSGFAALDASRSVEASGIENPWLVLLGFCLVALASLAILVAAWFHVMRPRNTP